MKISELRETIRNKKGGMPLDFYNVGDKLACFAGYPTAQFYLITIEKPMDINNANDCISGDSYWLTTSAVISGNWHKVN